MKTSTIPAPAPQWVLMDADGQSLGRLAAAAATRLRGKHRVTFSPHQLCGDHVVVVNARKLALHPTKLHRKTYYKHKGMLGHLSKETLGEKMERNPTEVIQLAVERMLPPNRLRKQMLKRLHVFAEAQHDYEAQKPLSVTLP